MYLIQINLPSSYTMHVCEVWKLHYKGVGLRSSLRHAEEDTELYDVVEAHM